MVNRTFWLILLLPVLAFAQPDTLWTRNYYTNESINRYAQQAQETPQGDFLVSGRSGSFSWIGDPVWGSLDYQIRLAKITAQGELLWERDYPVPGWSQMFNIGETAYLTIPQSNGEFTIIAGYIGLGGLEGQAYLSTYLIRCDAAGDTLSTTHFFGAGRAGPHCAIRTRDGGAIVAGLTENDDDSTITRTAVFLLKLDSTGQQEWWNSAQVSINEWSHVTDICQTADGGYIAAGWWGYYEHLHLMRFDSLGDEVWRLAPQFPTYECYPAVAQAAEGAFIVTSRSWIFSPHDADVRVTRVSPPGEIEWSIFYDPAGLRLPEDLVVLADSSMLMINDVSVDDMNDYDTELVRFNPADGESLSSRHFGGDRGDGLFSVSPTSDGGLIGAGWMWTTTWAYDRFYLVRFAADAVTSPDREAIAGSPTLLTNSPNPFNAATKIRFSLPRTSKVRLAVYDLQGREVAVPADAMLSAGEHTYVFDAAGLPSGIYFSCLDVSGRLQTRKLVLLK